MNCWVIRTKGVCNFAVTACISISAFASLVDTSKGILSSTIGLKICAIIWRIEKYKSITKKKKKKHDETALLAKTNLDLIKCLISGSLTESYIERNCSFLIHVLREYDNMNDNRIQ